MNITLDYLRGRRVWLVKNFCVWGEYSAIDLLFVQTEITESSKRVIFNRIGLGGKAQESSFSALYDYKGNQLPREIESPKILVLPKNDVFCLMIEESKTDFKIVKGNNSSENGLVDLLIFELG